MQRDIRRLLQWLSVSGRSVDVDLRIIGILVQVEAITGDNEAQLSCVYKIQQRAQYGSLHDLKQHALQSTALCQSEITAPSQVA